MFTREINYVEKVKMFYLPKPEGGTEFKFFGVFRISRVTFVSCDGYIFGSLSLEEYSEEAAEKLYNDYLVYLEG